MCNHSVALGRLRNKKKRGGEGRMWAVAVWGRKGRGKKTHQRERKEKKTRPDATWEKKRNVRESEKERKREEKKNTAKISHLVPKTSHKNLGRILKDCRGCQKEYDQTSAKLSTEKLVQGTDGPRQTIGREDSYFCALVGQPYAYAHFFLLLSFFFCPSFLQPFHFSGF